MSLSVELEFSCAVVCLVLRFNMWLLTAYFWAMRSSYCTLSQLHLLNSWPFWSIEMIWPATVLLVSVSFYDPPTKCIPLPLFERIILVIWTLLYLFQGSCFCFLHEVALIVVLPLGFDMNMIFFWFDDVLTLFFMECLPFAVLIETSFPLFILKYGYKSGGNVSWKEGFLLNEHMYIWVSMWFAQES